MAAGDIATRSRDEASKTGTLGGRKIFSQETGPKD